jgi:hypothetical protein
MYRRTNKFSSAFQSSPDPKAGRYPTPIKGSGLAITYYALGILLRLFDCAAHRTVMHSEMSRNLCERVGAGFICLDHRHLRVAVLVLIPLQAADDAALDFRNL